MKYEDYETLLKGIVSNPDAAPVAVEGILSEIKKDLTNSESLTAAISEKDKRIAELQETNIKLFMAQTGKPDEEEEAKTWRDKKGTDALEAFIAERKEQANG